MAGVDRYSENNLREGRGGEGRGEGETLRGLPVLHGDAGFGFRGISAPVQTLSKHALQPVQLCFRRHS